MARLSKREKQLYRAGGFRLERRRWSRAASERAELGTAARILRRWGAGPRAIRRTLALPSSTALAHWRRGDAAIPVATMERVAVILAVHSRLLEVNSFAEPKPLPALTRPDRKRLAAEALLAGGGFRTGWRCGASWCWPRNGGPGGGGGADRRECAGTATARRRSRGLDHAWMKESHAMTRKRRKRLEPPDGGGGPDRALLRKLEAAGADLERIEKGEAPTPAELAGAPKLEFWCVAEDGPFRVLQGVVSGHPHLRDGALVATSPLVVLAEDETWARTLSRFYRLGVSLGAAMARQS